jgi:hypothetical protein
MFISSASRSRACTDCCANRPTRRNCANALPLHNHAQYLAARAKPYSNGPVALPCPNGRLGMRDLREPRDRHARERLQRHTPAASTDGWYGLCAGALGNRVSAPAGLDAGPIPGFSVAFWSIIQDNLSENQGREGPGLEDRGHARRCVSSLAPLPMVPVLLEVHGRRLATV